MRQQDSVERVARITLPAESSVDLIITSLGLAMESFRRLAHFRIDNRLSIRDVCPARLNSE